MVETFYCQKMESKFKKRETFDRFLIRFDHKNFFKRWLMVLDLFYEITIYLFVIIITKTWCWCVRCIFTLSVRLMKTLHTQCRIVVTVWREKFSRLRWFSLCELNKSLGISQRWWRKTWRFRWLKDVYPSSLFTDFLFLGREKSCYCFSLIFTYNLFTGAGISQRWFCRQ